MDMVSVVLRLSVVLLLGDDTRLTGHREHYVKKRLIGLCLRLLSICCIPADFSMQKGQQPILCLCIGSAAVLYKSTFLIRCRSPPDFDFT